MMSFEEGRLYACGEEGGDVAGFVRREGNTIAWTQPGGRERVYEIATVERHTDRELVFVDRLGRRFELRLLTVADYNARVRQGAWPAATDDDHLWRLYLQSLGYESAVRAAG